MPLRWLAELRRRHVFHMAGVYLVGAWLAVQVSATLLPVFGAPDWAMKLVVGVLAAAFLPAMAIAWWFELTPRGLELDPADAPNPGRRATDVRAIAPNSVAVLPLKAKSRGDEAERFADGLHDDLLTQLARIRSLKVISRTSVQEYSDTRKNLRRIASELNVAHIVEGSVQQERSHVRLNVQLVDARSDTHLWAECFDRELDDAGLFAMQSEVAVAIAKALQAQLLPDDADALNRRLTVDLGAWRAYRAALRLVDRADVGDFDRAAELIDEALGRDPAFAAAWALKARNAIARYWFGTPDERCRIDSRAALDKAVAMEPGTPEVRVAEGYYHYWGFRDFPRALAATSQALALRPNDPDVLRLQGFIQRRVGDFDAAAVSLKNALECDPRSGFGQIELALTLIRLRRFDDADGHVDLGLALDPMWGFGRMARALLLVEQQRDFEGALAQLEVPDAGNSQPAFRRWWLLNALGRYDEALAHADFGRYASDRSYWWPAPLMRGLTLRYAGRPAEAALRAALALIEAKRLSEPDYEPALGALCLARGALGQRDEASAAAAPYLRFAEQDAVQRDEARYLVATALALAGDAAEALKLLQTQCAGAHYNGLAHIERDPAFAALRDSVGYRRWRKRLPTPVAERRGRIGRGWLLAGILVGVALLAVRLGWPDAPATPAATAPPAAAVPEASTAPNAAARAAQTQARSIAVLPFTSVGAGVKPEVGLFADGLSEEILNSLTRIDGLATAGRASSFQFRARDRDPVAIGQRLGVRYIVNGRVRLDEARAYIDAELVRVVDGERLWSESYERRLDDVLDVQLGIADRVAAALDVVLDDRARERMRLIGLRNVEAFIAFQRGRALYAAAHDPARSDNLIATLREANVEFARVIELEPGFAPAYYLSTDLYNHLVMADDTAPEDRKRALAAARRDFRLAARQSFDDDEALLIEVDRMLASDDWRGLGAKIAEAVERQGYRTSNWLPVAAAFGFGAARLRHTENVIARDPLSSIGYVNAAIAANWAGQPRRTLEIVALGTEKMGGSPTMTLEALRAAIRLGDLERAKSLNVGIDPASANGAIAELLLSHAQGGDVAAVVHARRIAREPGWNPEVWIVVDFLGNVLAGKRAENNLRASRIDRQPGGALRLASIANQCQCGAPFDLVATPNFAERLIEAALPWPPRDLLAVEPPARE